MIVEYVKSDYLHCKHTSNNFRTRDVHPPSIASYLIITNKRPCKWRKNAIRLPCLEPLIACLFLVKYAPTDIDYIQGSILEKIKYHYVNITLSYACNSRGVDYSSKFTKTENYCSLKHQRKRKKSTYLFLQPMHLVLECGSGINKKLKKFLNLINKII